jgi:alpha-amylase/alpha-mannosidase (GH57 family)
MERAQPTIYQAIIEADRRSRKRFSGHGSALAQAYNHIIMPLANRRDKLTQVLWGMADFRHRFGREPEGMWLPETAVDLETLGVMAEQGVRFTILAPNQAEKVRRIDEENWRDVSGSGIDPRMPYLCKLPSGRRMVLFFYDGPTSRDVAFSGLLRDGAGFAERLLAGFSGGQPQMFHIATDGETYGHHHRFGEMALAYCLRHIENEERAQLTIYPEYLAKHPPTHEVEIIENTSWSCAHGVERWRSDCGCRIGGDNDWNQAWRGPLREALDWLRDELVTPYEKEMSRLAGDPWGARDAYIEVILDRSPEKVKDFLARQSGRELSAGEQTRSLRLLEMQRHAMLMYTSCGWFFDEISGIESTQVLFYAGRVVQLAREACGIDLEAPFLNRLESAPSNLPRVGNAARIFEREVKSEELDLIRVAAHHAIASEFDEDGDTDENGHQIYCYRVERSEHTVYPGGRMKLAVGRARIRSAITWNEEEFAFSVLHLGGHHLNAGIRPFESDAAFAAMQEAVSNAFERSDIPAVIREMDRHFGSHNYTLWHLFRDERRRVVGQVIAQNLEEIEATFRSLYENQFTLLRFLREIRMPIPKPLALPAEVVLVSRLRGLLEKRQPPTEELRQLADEVENLELPLDDPMLGMAAGRQIARQLEKFGHPPDNLDLLISLIETLEVLHSLPIKLDLWQAQNLFWEIHRKCRAEMDEAKGEKAISEWRDSFQRLGDLLEVRIA